MPSIPRVFPDSTSFRLEEVEVCAAFIERHGIGSSLELRFCEFILVDELIDNAKLVIENLGFRPLADQLSGLVVTEFPAIIAPAVYFRGTHHPLDLRRLEFGAVHAGRCVDFLIDCWVNFEPDVPMISPQEYRWAGLLRLGPPNSV